MSGRWHKVYPGLLNDPKVQLLPRGQFWSEFCAAIRGEPSVFSPYVRPGRDRPSGPVWSELRSAVFHRDDYTCQYCGTRGGRLECDHVVPVARGGQSDPENLATACFDCNRSKRAKLLSEWRR